MDTQITRSMFRVIDIHMSLKSHMKIDAVVSRLFLRRLDDFPLELMSQQDSGSLPLSLMLEFAYVQFF